MWEEIHIKFPWLKFLLVDRNRFWAIRGIKLWKILAGLVDTPIPRRIFSLHSQFEVWVHTHWISCSFRFYINFLLIEKNRKQKIYKNALPTIGNFWIFFSWVNEKKEEIVDWNLFIGKDDGKNENIKSAKLFWSEINAYKCHKEKKNLVLFSIFYFSLV